MRSLLFVSLLLSPFAAFSGAVRYEISPVFQDNALTRLQVRVFLRGDADGITTFSLPGEFGPASQLFDCVQNLVCPTSGCTLEVDRDAHRATVQHSPSADLELRYEVVQDFPGGSFAADKMFRPVIQPGFFHVLGTALFVAPLFSDGKCEVTLEWQDFPPDWLMHNSFGSRQQVQQFQCAHPRWLESVFVGGDFRVLKTEVEHRPVYLAVRGDDWAFPDEDLLAMLQKTVATQRAFWRDWDIPYYTVTLLPLAQHPVTAGGEGFFSIEYAGTGLRNSFAAFVTPAPRLAVQDLRHLFNHEMMHDWIGSKIRSGSEPGNMRFAWFTEGFTEYFAWKNLLASSFVTTDEYVEALNEEFVKRLYDSPIGESPNSLIQTDFFAQQAVADLAYKRGFVFAFFLDNAIKSASDGKQNLHDFMLDLLEYYAAPNRTLLSNFDFFEENLSEYLQKPVAPLLEQHIEAGKFIAAGAFVLPEYWNMETDGDGVPVFKLDKTRQGWEERMRE